jgi:DNA-binding MarR family transcriptional regulator
MTSRGATTPGSATHGDTESTGRRGVRDRIDPPDRSSPRSRIDPRDPHEIAAAWDRELPGVPTRSVVLVSAVKQVAAALRHAREQALRAAGVDAATLDLLSTLRRSGDPYVLTTRDLAERCLVSAGAISQRVARAEREDLVTRSAGAGRRVDVTLTAAGHALVERTAAQVLAADEALLHGIDDATLARLEQALTGWSQDLRRTEG